MAIQHLERREAANVKWLEEMWRMGGHAQGDDLVPYTELVKLRCSVAAVAV
jgi:hypothetical protein